MHVGMGVCTAGNCTCFYDGQCHPFSEVEGVARTRWPFGPVKPPPLVQAGQIRPAPPVGARKTWDPADRSIRRTTRTASADSEVRPGPRPRPYAHTSSNPGKPGRPEHYPHPPCRLRAALSWMKYPALSAQIAQVWAGSPLLRNAACPAGASWLPGRPAAVAGLRVTWPGGLACRAR